ncbi:acyl--CoA ligase [Lachnospiraceae bacterium MD335]|nr:acyl--CoA ligase [Lachnospiraceae bacterium MD335]
MLCKEINLIYKIVEKHKQNEKVAIETEEGYITYSQLYREVYVLASKLYMFQRKRVIILMQNSSEFIIAYFALHKLNCVIIPLYAALSIEEIEKCYEFCDADLIITESMNLKQVHVKRNSIINFYCMNSRELCLNVFKTKYSCESDSLVEIMRTSGSLTSPKYVQFSDDAIINNILGNIEALEITEDERALVVLPMAFSYCLHAQVLSYLYSGATIIIKPNKVFTPNGLMRLLNEKAITSFAVVPEYISQYVKSGNRYFIPTLRKIFLGADFSSIDLRSQIQYCFGNVQVYVTYGMTEAGPRISTLKYNKNHVAAGSVGKPLKNVQCKIIDDNDIELQPYKKGEIIIKTPSIMIGYYKNEILTRQVIQNSWLHTGDYGYVDIDGNIYFVGRKKNIIKINGILIYPEQVEECIMQYPNVKRACVTAEKSGKIPDVLVATIAIWGKEITEQDIIKYCKEKLPKEMIPQKVFIVNKIETTVTGKILRDGACGSI